MIAPPAPPQASNAPRPDLRASQGVSIERYFELDRLLNDYSCLADRLRNAALDVGRLVGSAPGAPRLLLLEHRSTEAVAEARACVHALQGEVADVVGDTGRELRIDEEVRP